MIAGRRETFAIEVRPLAGPPPEGDPAAAATWTAMRIYVEGRNVFRNVQREGREVSDDVNWPAVGVARWLTRSWTKLFHSGAWSRPGLSRTARDFATLVDQSLAEVFDAPEHDLDARDAFVSAHSLRAAAAGAAFPDLWFVRDGEVMSIAWHDSMDGDIYFTLSRGEADVPAVEFAEACRAFVEWVRDALRDRCATEAASDIRLLEGWLERYASPAAAIDGLLEETGLGGDRWRRVAREAGVTEESPEALLGVRPASLAPGTLVDARVSSIALAFRCTSPVLSDRELVGLRTAITAVPRNKAGFGKLQGLAGRVGAPAPSAFDFTRGYALAREVRHALGNPSAPLDVEALVRDLDIPVMELRLSDPSLDGGCVCDESNGPAIFVNPASKRGAVPWGKRVVLAHELCHLLFDRKTAVSLAVISGPWAPPRIERTANAFAIELLLPLAGVVETVGRAWEDMTDDDVKVLMDKFGLGVTAVTEHIRNLGNPRNR